MSILSAFGFVITVPEQRSRCAATTVAYIVQQLLFKMVALASDKLASVSARSLLFSDDAVFYLAETLPGSFSAAGCFSRFSWKQI